MMPDPRIAELEAELAALRHVPEPEPEPEPQDSQPEAEVANDPEPEPKSMYAESLHPDAAMAKALPAAHAVGGHEGLGTAVSN